jgi:uncharacterized repeat protein (TIGR04076 family)
VEKKEFDWNRLQKHLQYSEEELELFKKDPKKFRAAQRLFSPDAARMDLIVEVVESHGCSAGMKPGDRLVFRALGVMDIGKSSSGWCAQALGEIPGFANMAQDRFISGLDPNDMYINHFSCMDAGPRCGWGQVVMKVYVEKHRSDIKR